MSRRSFFGRVAALALLAALATVDSARGESSELSPHAEAPGPALPAPLAPPPRNPLALGAVLVTNSRSWSGFWRRPDTAGALVAAVLPGSAAEAAGLSPGDVIVAVDGAEVSSSDRAVVLQQSATGPRHVLSLSGVSGLARSLEVELTSPEQSAASYLRRRLGESGDLASRYLYAQKIASPSVALQLADALIASDPAFAPAYALRARLLVETSPRHPNGAPSPDLRAEVASIIQRAIELDPGSADIRSEAGRAYLELGDATAAEEAGAAALQRNPDSASAHRLLGAARLSIGGPGAALADLRQAVELDPYEPGHYEQLAQAYTALGRPDDAAKTQQALLAVRSQGTRQPAWGPKATSVARALAAVVLGIGLVVLVGTRDHRPSYSLDRKARHRSARERAMGLAEASAALGIWAATLPLISPALGLAPESTRALEFADHVLPGVATVIVSLACLFVLLKPGPEPNALLAAPAVVFLAAFWITATHAPLVLQAAQHVRPWSLALFHSSAGPPLMVVAARLYLVLARSEAQAAEPAPTPA